MKGLQGIFAGVLAGLLCFASASAHGLHLGAQVFHLGSAGANRSVPGALRGLSLIPKLSVGALAEAPGSPSIVPDLLTSLSFAVEAPKIAVGVQFGAAVAPVRIVSLGAARFQTPQPETVGESFDQASPQPLRFDFGDPSQQPAFQAPVPRSNILGRLLGAIRGNPKVSVLYRDPAAVVTYMVQGRARVVEGDADREAVWAGITEGERRHNSTSGERTGTAVVIEVDALIGGALGAEGVIASHVEMRR